MDIVYEGKKINLNINKCILKDNIEGKSDSIEVSFADIKSECSTWEFRKGDTINVIDEQYSTGIMYVDNYSASRGKYHLKALSIKNKFKNNKTRPWENITFNHLVNDLVNELGLSLETYGVNDIEYYRIDQINRNNIEFLRNICILEGYILKITNNKAVIISEKYLENQSPVIELSPSDFIGDYNFECTSNSIYGGCILRSNEKEYIEGKYILNSSFERILYVNDVPAYSLGEANRFSKNILRAYNKNEITGKFIIKNSNNIAAGSTITINGVNSFKGKYIVENITKDIINGKAKVKVRKVLEEY